MVMAIHAKILARNPIPIFWEKTDSLVPVRLTRGIFRPISLAKICRPLTLRQSRLVGWIGRLPKPLVFGE